MTADQTTQRDLFEHRPAWAEDDLRVGTIATVVLPDGVDKPLDYLVPEQLAAAVEPGLLPGALRGDQVPDVHRIEAPAEHTDPHDVRSRFPDRRETLAGPQRTEIVQM